MTENKKKSTQDQSIAEFIASDKTEADIPFQKDRIGEYFKKHLKQLVFSEFSPAFMEKSKAGNLMKDVPVPLRIEDLKTFTGGEGLPMKTITENMILVMGADPNFKHTKDYAAIFEALYDDKLFDHIMQNGDAAVDRGNLEAACIFFRAALCIQPHQKSAIFNYAIVCKSLYEESDNREFIGRFKAESLEYLELTTERYPEFAPAYYHLGYAYLNLGLYTKADLTWEAFLSLTENDIEGKEITDRREQLKEPVQIESGYNDILATRYKEGLEKLEPFRRTRFESWWPLHYYLGLGYQMTGRMEDAITCFKRVLTLNGSHLETIDQLVEIYKESGDEENYQKYAKKAKLIRKQMEEEKQQI